MKILIAGGAGFIGSNLCAYHIAKRHEVYAIDNLITGKRDNIKKLLASQNFHFFENDIVTFDFSVFPKFDVVYHLASPASPLQYKKYPLETLLVNSLGTHKLLEFTKNSYSQVFVLA